MNSNDLPWLQLKGIWLGYQQAQLGPLTADFFSGQRYVLTGPNGSGKSLLLKTLAGQLKVRQGRLKWQPGIQAAYLAQEHPRPSPWPLNGYDWMQAMGASEQVVKVPESLLEKRLDQISGGQWQLLRLAAVVNSQAQILLMDEPGNHLDKQVRAESLRFLERLPENKLLLMASHDPDFITASGAVELPLASLFDPQT